MLNENVYTYSMPRKGSHATAILDFPKMTVQAGSVVSETETPTLYEHSRMLRKTLTLHEVIIRIDKDLVFSRDYVFDSATAAVCVVEGGNRSGHDSWKDHKGRTLNDNAFHE